MKILVFSDTHGDFTHMNDCIKRHPDAEVIVHCGDGADQAQRVKLLYPDKMVVCVRGNCDLASPLPAVETFTVLGKNIMVTHGHYYEVKYHLTKLFYAAKENRCDIVLFGHTHEATDRYEDGVYLFNPGNCSGWRPTYGVIEITEKGDILTNIAKA